MTDREYGSYVGNIVLCGTQVYDDYLVAHTVRLMEYEHALLIRSGSFGLDHTGGNPTPQDMLDAIHERFMHDVARGASRHDRRLHDVTFYRGKAGEPHGLTVIADKVGTRRQYAMGIELQSFFLTEIED